MAEPTDLSRRCGILNLPPDLLVAMLASGNWFKLTAQAPPDAEFVAVTASFERQTIQVLVRSAEFPETPMDHEFPTAGLVNIEYQPDAPPHVSDDPAAAYPGVSEGED